MSGFTTEVKVVRGKVKILILLQYLCNSPRFDFGVVNKQKKLTAMAVRILIPVQHMKHEAQAHHEKDTIATNDETTR